MFDLLTDELLDLTATQRGMRHAFFARYTDCCCSACCCCCDAG